MSLVRLRFRTGGPVQLIDITDDVRRRVEQSGVREGICLVFVPHSTAGVTVNEHADPGVARDLIAGLDRLVPARGDYTHAEGNSPAHIKASLMGSSVQLPIYGGRLHLGTWQGVFLCEFDGPRERSVELQILGNE